MDSIKVVNRRNARQVSKAIEVAAHELADAFGMKARLAGVAFGSSSVVVKVELAVVDSAGRTTTREAEAFQRFASAYGMRPEWLGRTVWTTQRGDLTITGLNARSTKFPVMVTDQDGNQFGMPVQTVLRQLAGKMDSV